MGEGYPYTTAPNKLREFLKGLPSRAVPDKVTVKYLISIGMKSTADRSIIPVLKAVNLLDNNGNPTENYKTFRDGSRGPPLLATLIRATYDGLYKVYEDAHNQSDQS